jgi:hypothetical protein
MTIKNGDVFRWETEQLTRCYVIEHDLVDIKPELAGLHWCRLYSLNPRTGEIKGYRTVLSPQYFSDVIEASRGALTRVDLAQERQRILEQIRHVPTPVRGLHQD